MGTLINVLICAVSLTLKIGAATVYPPSFLCAIMLYYYGRDGGYLIASGFFKIPLIDLVCHTT